MIEKALKNLLIGPQFAMSYEDKRELLLPLLQEQARRCAQGNSALAKQWREMGFSGKKITDYHDLPFLPVSMFKEFELATVPSTDIVRTLLSSSTTGNNPSRIPLNKVTSKRQARGLAAILKDQLGNKRRPFLVLDVPEINQPGQELTARGAAVRGIMPFASQITYALRLDGEGFSLDIQAMEKFFEDHAHQEILAFGFTYLVWTEVCQALHKTGKKFDHPAMTLLHSGGWKRLTEQEVSKETFSTEVGKVFGCTSDRVRDFYGMVEQVGVVFVDCEAGHKHSPAFAEVAIRDFTTLKQVAVGETGLIQVMSLLPDSYPGYALITEDVGEMLGLDDCACGRPGLHFRFRSRVQQVEVRGCGDTVAASRIRATEPIVAVEPMALAFISNEVTILAGTVPGSETDPFQIFNELGNQFNLDPIPSAAVIGLLDDAATHFLVPELAHIEGLAFLSAWMKRRNLERVLETNFGHQRAALDGPFSDAGSAILAAPRGIVGHWVAGNVPTLAVFSWVLSTLAGNRNILRVSQENISAARQLFQAIAQARFNHSGIDFSGEDLLNRSSILHFDSANQKLNQAMSLACDARCIWGGTEAVASVRGLAAPEHGEDLVFGPKFSLGMVDRQQLADSDKAARLAKILAREVALFDQAACSSPQILFLEGTIEEHQEWLQILHHAMAEIQKKSPRKSVSETAAAAIIRHRGQYGLDANSRVWASSGTEYTILARDGAELVDAIQARVLFVRGVDGLGDILPLITPKIQTVGLAVANVKLRNRLSHEAARRGVSRLVPLGTMNFFETPWDGLLPVSRLVRWVRLPSVEEKT